MGFLGALLGSSGPSKEMKQTAAEQSSLANTLFSNYQTQFQNQSSALAMLKQAYTPLVAAGPNQQGFSSPELAALHTQAINSTGAAARNARQASGNFSAGQNSSSGLTSGITKQINASINSSAAQKLSDQQLGITEANYATGRENYKEATAGLNTLAGQYNPTAYAGQAGQNFSESFGQAKEINAETQAAQAAKFGAIASLGIDAATFGAGGIANLGAGESFGEGVGDFFSGGAKALGQG
jgi:hypothetical protein